MARTQGLLVAALLLATCAAHGQTTGGNTGTATSSSVTSQAPFTGANSRFVIMSTPQLVISNITRAGLAYHVTGGPTDYACAVWASSAPTFTITGTATGTSADCTAPGSFVLQGTNSSYPSNGLGIGAPNAPGQALYAQCFSGTTLGTCPSDSFTVSAQW